MSRAQHLAIKNRPRNFEEVLGQENVIRSLRGMLKRDGLPPAILFHGPHSTGKTTLGRLLPLYANCQNPSEDFHPCGECASCKLMEGVIAGNSVHPDVAEMNAALNGGIDVIRKLQSLAPQAPRYNTRFFLMDEAHRITDPAFKGALKLIEDPPKRAVFVFLTTNVEKIPPPIRSRCIPFQLSPLPTKTIARRLFSVSAKEGFRPPKKELQKLCIEIASATGGHLREAYGLLYSIICQAADHEGDVDWSTLLPKIVQSTPALAPYLLVKEYMVGILDTHFSVAFMALQESENHTYFLQRVLETWGLIISTWIDSKNLVDPGKSWMLRDLKIPSMERGQQLLAETDDIPRILNEYTTALERVRSYSSDPNAVIQAATIRVIQIIDKWT